MLLLLSKERNLCVFVGDNESRPFTDALSQLSYSVGEKVTFSNITGNFLLVPLKSSCTTSKRLHSYFCFNQFLLFNFLVFFRVLFGVFFSQHILRDIYDLSNWNCFNVQDLRISVWSMSPSCLCSVLLANRYVYIFTEMKYHMSRNKLTFVLIILLQKTKPTQQSVRDLRGLGLTPDIIACRSTKVYLSILVSSPLVLWYITKTLIILSFLFSGRYLKRM